MINSLLIGPADYVIFLQGLLFFLTAALCFLIRGADKNRGAYLWLGLFACARGVGKTADILMGGLGADCLGKFLDNTRSNARRIKEVMHRLNEIERPIAKDYLPGIKMLDLEKSG